MGRAPLAFAQIATDLFADPKVRKLFRRQDERIAYAAMGLWLDVLTSSWAKGAREPTALERSEDVELISALQDVQLLDADGRIPEATWEKWWGPVLESRRAKADAQARWRAGKRGEGGDGESGVDDRRSLHASPSSPLLSSTPLSSTELPIGDESPARARHAGANGARMLLPATLAIPTDAYPVGADSLDVYERLTMRVPTKDAMDWLDRLVSEHGETNVGSALASEWTSDPTLRTFLSRTERRLHRETKEREEREAREERRRESELMERRAEEAANARLAELARRHQEGRKLDA